MAPKDREFEEVLDEGLRALDADLSAVLAASRVPLEVVDGVEAACRTADALRVAAPAGLSDRVYRATAGSLPSGNGVLARIGPRIAWAAGLAAAVALALLVFRGEPVQTQPIDVAQIERSLERAEADWELAGPVLPELDARAISLAIEIDELQLAMESDAVGGLFADHVYDLVDDLMLLEVQDVF